MNERERKIEAIKDFLMRYCEPKPEYSGIMAGELAKKMMDEIQQIGLDFEYAS